MYYSCVHVGLYHGCLFGEELTSCLLPHSQTPPSRWWMQWAVSLCWRQGMRRCKGNYACLHMSDCVCVQTTRCKCMYNTVHAHTVHILYSLITHLCTYVTMQVSDSAMQKQKLQCLIAVFICAHFVYENGVCVQTTCYYYMLLLHVILYYAYIHNDFTHWH